MKKLKIYSDLKKLFKNKKEILDILIFGSIIKGKSNPKDIDICIIFRENIDINLIKELNKKFEDVHFSTLIADNFFTKPHALIKTLLFEGISIKTGKELSKVYGMNAYALYSYNITKLSNSKKTRFVYLLKGRKGENGIVKDFKGEFITNAAFIIPVEKDYEMIEIFNSWEVPFNRKKIMTIN
ncbi:MAG: nucleotidyltransferase domain-containing protein [Nanoarchaeota archaeon]|nr:nucleotidyltransferase domain-containing protein [Nanoarchaeota archaeon]